MSDTLIDALQEALPALKQGKLACEKMDWESLTKLHADAIAHVAAALASPVATVEPEKCAHCGKPATCTGNYDNDGDWAACDGCCTHSQEGGHCAPIATGGERRECSVEESVLREAEWQKGHDAGAASLRHAGTISEAERWEVMASLLSSPLTAEDRQIAYDQCTAWADAAPKEPTHG